MKGFFDLEDKNEEKTIKILKEKKKKTKCDKCGLKKKSKQNYFIHGKKNNFLIIIDFYKQDISCIENSLNHIDYTLTFALRCTNEKNITDNQINCCRENLKKVIEEIKPKKILTFGLYALKSLIGDKISVTNIDTFVGYDIPDQEYQCFIFPNYHINNDSKQIIKNKYIKYLNNSLNHNRKFKEYNPKVNIDDENLACLHLRTLNSLKEEIIAIDFETSGLKPHRKEHFIYSCAITQKNLFTFSFVLTKKIKKHLIEIFENKNIMKIAHNVGFEKKWSKEKLNCDIKNIFFDTQLASHILDNRRGITGLKFQTYVNFGIFDYNKKIDKFLKGETSNSLNSIKEASIDDLLEYNGLDTYFTMLLYKKQKRNLTEHLQKGFSLFFEGNTQLSSLSGIRFDKKKCEKHKKELTKKIDKLHNDIMNSKESKKWENRKLDEKKKEVKELNYNSSSQLRKLLYEICKYKNVKKTVDEEALTKLNIDFTNKILEIRKLKKIRDTYLKQFEREVVFYKDDYYIFPFFILNNVSSLRSSSQNPNFQNIPIRNKEAKYYTRSCIIPRQQHQLLEIDFKTLEVCIGCAYHKDPKLIDYIVNRGDMHADVANLLFFRKNDFIDMERFIAKNGFVFPAFYGSTARLFSDELKKRKYGDITLNIWEMISENTKKHLEKNGIKNIFDFQKHVEEIENDFWYNRFPIYNNWKFENWKMYKEKGYIDLYTGFRITSNLGFNQCNNLAIQGSAFHVALKTLIELNKFLIKEKFNSLVIGEIHDSVVIDLDPLELKFISIQINKILEKIKNEWTWINVPLRVEYEITEINGSWDTKKEIIL